VSASYFFLKNRVAVRDLVVWQTPVFRPILRCLIALHENADYCKRASKGAYLRRTDFPFPALEEPQRKGLSGGFAPPFLPLHSTVLSKVKRKVWPRMPDGPSQAPQIADTSFNKCVGGPDVISEPSNSGSFLASTARFIPGKRDPGTFGKPLSIYGWIYGISRPPATLPARSALRCWAAGTANSVSL
jgi:hypothetical protein